MGGTALYCAPCDAKGFGVAGGFFISHKKTAFDEMDGILPLF
jgi:hypothetical protein